MPWPLYPKERDPVSLYRRPGGLQGWSVWVWKILPPPGFDPWTVQLVEKSDIHAFDLFKKMP
jgi:hypothetical protein